jgi:hypothetical protein
MVVSHRRHHPHRPIIIDAQTLLTRFLFLIRGTIYRTQTDTHDKQRYENNQETIEIEIYDTTINGTY